MVLEIILKAVFFVSLVYAGYSLTRFILTRTGSNPLADYMGADRMATSPTLADRAGAALKQRWPFSLETWESHLRWAQRGGEYQGQTVGRQLFVSLLAGLTGLVFPLIGNAPILWTGPLVAGAFPYIRLRSTAKKIIRRAEKSLPEMAALIAAEIAAGVSEENALTVVAQIPGPLAGLIGEAILHAGKTGLPLLSHETRKGALRTILDDSGSPALRAFGVQLDVAAAKGVEVDERMNELSQSLSAQHRNRMMRSTEKLETSLTIAVAVFYFLPMITLILAPLMIELIGSL
jgi:tight adherence protein C